MLIVLEVVLVAIFAHAVSMGSNYTSFADYISTSYSMAEGGVATCSAGGNNTTIYIFENGEIIAQHHGFNTIGTVCPNSYLELDSFVHKKIDGHDIIIIEWYEWDEYCNSNHTSIFCDGKLVYYNHLITLNV